jgi:hypothetical protein
MEHPGLQVDRVRVYRRNLTSRVRSPLLVGAFPGEAAAERGREGRCARRGSGERNGSVSREVRYLFGSRRMMLLG